jgi:hypothetical protein
MAGLYLKRILAIAVSKVIPEVGDRPPQYAHALRLLPMALLVSYESLLVHVLS